MTCWIFRGWDARGADFFAKVGCDTVLDDAIRNLRSLIEESGAIITREPLPVVTGDAIQLTRPFQNLLANSIQEFPRIHVAADGGTGVWRFSVRDNRIIWVESELGKGATFYFTLPKNE